jgi:hypothetical protein
MHTIAPRVERITVTPDLAHEWLRQNTRNRKLKDNVVRRYAVTMREGRWRCTLSQPITFDWNFVLQEGQHRLSAIVASGVACDMWVAFDADPDDFPVVGAGSTRTVGDVLGMSGKTDVNVRGAAARQAAFYKAMPDKVWSTQLVTQISRDAVVNEALREVYDQALAMSRRVRAMAPRVTATTTVAHIALALDHSVHADKLEAFLEALGTGADLQYGSPVLTLRNWYLSDNGVGRIATGTWATQRRLALHLRAWNAFVTSEPLKVLKFNPNNLPMPAVK